MADLSEADLARVPVLAAFADTIFPALPEQAAACEKAADAAGAGFFGTSGGDMKEALHMVSPKISFSLHSCKPLHLNYPKFASGAAAVRAQAVVSCIPHRAEYSIWCVPCELWQRRRGL